MRRWRSLCTPESAKQTQNSWQLCLFLSLAIWKRGSREIGAIRRNKLLNHSGAAVWRRVHSRLLFGCQGRPSGIRRSGKRVQSWYKRMQCSGLECLQCPTIWAQFLRFLVLCLWPSMTPPRSAQRCGLHRATFQRATTGGLQALHALSIPTDWRALVAIPMSHFLVHPLLKTMISMCSLTVVKTEQLSSILVQTNFFAMHCAESAGHLYLRCAGNAQWLTNESNPLGNDLADVCQTPVKWKKDNRANCLLTQDFHLGRTKEPLT